MTWKYEVDPQVVMLGTGSMIPNSYRGVSSILVRLDPDLAIVLDCGEGSFSQLCNQYTNDDELAQVLQSIRIVYITHLHGDHSFGTAGFVAQREAFLLSRGIVAAPLTLMVPFNFGPWLAMQKQWLAFRNPVSLLFTNVYDGSALVKTVGAMSKDKLFCPLLIEEFYVIKKTVAD